LGTTVAVTWTTGAGASVVVVVACTVVYLVVKVTPPAGAPAPAPAGSVGTLPMGHTVVYTGTTSVVTLPMRAGQFVTMAAHEVMV
jgi:hypothetical protein